ncbi:hypothetical protein BDZ89DRAFT_45087 [Hymenopellis radicata]|nr:hypothetical protein BDZ89DRAFT_45087 [Hymenopellis radicata]
MTLAQRLNELAAANSDGLLNDDEYRMLRQNLFERFATSSTVPSEAPVVPAIPRHQSQGSEGGRTSTTSRPPSNFVVEVPRSPSIRSKGSVSSFFRRSSSNTRRTPAGSKDFSDTSSIFSSTSGTSNIFKRLTKKASTSSIASMRTEASRPAADTMSITSRRTGIHVADRGDYNSLPHLPSASRSTASSIRRFATPPSSFPGGKVLASDPKYTGHVQDVFEEENLKGSGEIKQELAAVDAERKRLMDAFNGLELTTLTKRNNQRKTHDDGRDLSTWTLIPSQRRGDSDATSVRSGNSMSTTYTGRRVVRQKTSSSLATMSSKPGSLHRKNSISSMSSGKGMPSTNGGVAPPPVPSLPISVALGSGFNNSSSSINLSRSTGHLPMTSVPEDEAKSVSGHSSKSGAQRQRDEADQELELEMEDIRRRRQEVSTRYEARMEYLRAKLKGAQLHEKLMKK